MSMAGAQLSAVLGPTNTGKTHLAIERMCAHSGGMIGFPLRLLAREVYDRVVALKGAPQVALVTGEERIVPEGARYFLCTTESMVTDRTFPFLAIDEAQMAADPERGHVFTNAVLHLRGTYETMILGADTLRPLLRRLLPDARIVERPRFSKLSWTEPRKLSRLPPRSAVVAFTAEEVYAIAEMLRRQKGGAAVVMGGLSPRTRNAQVALYQSGEVDYLVATDAIGMGLNMDIAHVAFASLSKFDGRRHRRLSPAEMAQIAGRAGRHQRDGSFGSVQIGQEAGEAMAAFTDAEIVAIEHHGFEPLSRLMWRNARLDFASLPRLIASLDAMPSSPDLWRSEDAVDLRVLKILAADPAVLARAEGRPALQRLWAACGLPDYRKTGAEQHARLVGRMFRHLSDGNGHLPAEWIRAELAVLDNVAGDIATLSDRIAAARTWTYVSHRSGWLADSAHWMERARDVENRLSDALHQRLTQRFIDRRTSLLLRGLGRRGADLAVEVDPDGAVVAGGIILGTLSGFSFRADPSARAGEKRMLLAAAERRLAAELRSRAEALCAAADGDFALRFDGSMPPALCWRGSAVATLARGRDALNPLVRLDHSLATLPDQARRGIETRLAAWVDAELHRRLASLMQLGALRPELSPAARGLVVQLTETLGVLPRASVASLLESLTAGDRRALRQAGVRLGVVHVFIAELLRPAATRWRLALWGVADEIGHMPPPPRPGQVSLRPDHRAPPGFYAVAGFWMLDGFAVRVDMADRAARLVHARRMQRRAAGEGIRTDAGLMTGLGLGPAEFALLMRALGFRGSVEHGFRYLAEGGRRRRKPAAAAGAASPFADLGAMLAGGRRQ